MCDTLVAGGGRGGGGGRRDSTRVANVWISMIKSTSEQKLRTFNRPHTEWVLATAVSCEMCNRQANLTAC